jgi:tetratricopeptide (TPR) repeat protein
VLREAEPPTQPAETDQSTQFNRQQVRRLLHITERVLRTWERQQLVPERQEYRFSDLLLLKTIVRLRSEKIPTTRIRRALIALKDRLKGAADPLSEVRVFAHGQHVRVQMGRVQMEAVSGQLLFDFDEQEITKLLQLPNSARSSHQTAELLRRKMEADGWFERGLELEQRGAPIDQIVAAYQKAADLDPKAAGALVNLGTVYFNGHAWADAEHHYLKALEIDPNYALAHFNLGNLYDEQGDHPNALLHYREAIRLYPQYADAHYNLALLHQNAGEVMDAVRHWRAYLRLDGNSSWGQIARRELAKLESVTVIAGRGARAAATVRNDC